MHKLLIQKKTRFKKKKIALATITQQKQQKRKCNLVDDETDGCQEPVKRTCYELLELNNNNHKTISFKKKEEAIYQTNLNELDLWFLTEVYESLHDWKKIGKQHLNILEQELSVIEAKYLSKDNLKECFYQMLLKWRLKEPENCFFEYLYRSLKLSNAQASSFLEFKTKSQHDNDVCIKRFECYYRKYFNQEDCDAFKNLKLTEKNLWHASGYLFQEWKSIARYACLAENDICLIDSRHYAKDGIRECCYQMLLKWKELLPSECNLYALCAILLQLNLNFYVCQLLEYFSKQQ